MCSNYFLHGVCYESLLIDKRNQVQADIKEPYRNEHEHFFYYLIGSLVISTDFKRYPTTLRNAILHGHNVSALCEVASNLRILREIQVHISSAYWLPNCCCCRCMFSGHSSPSNISLGGITSSVFCLLLAVLAAGRGLQEYPEERLRRAIHSRPFLMVIREVNLMCKRLFCESESGCPLSSSFSIPALLNILRFFTSCK